MLHDRTRFQKHLLTVICQFVIVVLYFAKYKPASLYLAIFDGAKSHLYFEIVETIEQNDILLLAIKHYLRALISK